VLSEINSVLFDVMFARLENNLHPVYFMLKRLTQRGKESMMPKKKKGEEEEAQIKALKNQLMYKNSYGLVTSELDGIYDEIDKLCKKAPNEPVTTLQLGIVNRLIEKIKRLFDNDKILKEISTFIAAGDNPEYRDVLTVLRQLKQALNRFHQKYSYIFNINFRDELGEYGIDPSDVLDIFEPEKEEG